MLELFGHPFSSYCWKALIALYENDTPFVFRMVDAEHPENATRLQAVSPQGKFPVLVEDERAIFEASVIIEYLQVHHPGPVQLIPREPEAGIDVRMLDRLFDNYVMTPMQAIVGNSLREEKDRSARNVADAQDMLRRSYGKAAGGQAVCQRRFQSRRLCCRAFAFLCRLGLPDFAGTFPAEGLSCALAGAPFDQPLRGGGTSLSALLPSRGA